MNNKITNENKSKMNINCKETKKLSIIRSIQEIEA